MTEISPVETENPAGGFTKTVSHVVLGLKSAKGKIYLLMKKGNNKNKEKYCFLIFRSLKRNTCYSK